ncbi:unnamed protein product [Spirodela intermedia]|uniref:Uncharacterized protein n=1 Tax=Spirodela intermedia TaxID=51605 RepID=A0A7I8J2M6_SPIIN|nr:unnamed protein product [Spirodela intermedia]CAA6664309.1 unnamed protein product [Spirodela intermedia]
MTIRGFSRQSSRCGDQGSGGGRPNDASGSPSSPAIARSRLLLVLLPLFMWVSVFSADSSSGCCSAGGDRSVSREFFPIEGDVAWVVQVSDLHLSAYDHDRARDLEPLLGPALRVVRPSFLIVTGDLTDAKNKERTSTRQDELEWVQYRNSMDAVIRKAGMGGRRVLDIRGNHDKYGVPCVGDKLDFFSVYSTSALMNRTGNIQSISLVGNELKYMFIGVDDTMAVGLRGLSNLFGHPTDSMIQTLDAELRYWDANPLALTAKIVFGHFPISFTASSKTGNRYEEVFSRRSVSAYLCGHLHAKFSSQLWRPHVVKGVGDSELKMERSRFWEWELGDWKESRLMRIVAVDRGNVTFLDTKVNPGLEDDHFPTTILITYPVDSRSMSQMREDGRVVRKDIDALVFSLYPIRNVTAKVYDSSRGYRPVEEIPLRRATNSLSSQPLFSAKWNAENYKSPSADRYFLQTTSILRPFSVEGRFAPLPTTWLAYLALYVPWESLYAVLLWSNISFLTALLLLPRVSILFMEPRRPYQSQVLSASLSSSAGRRRLYSWPLWFLVEGEERKAVAFYGHLPGTFAVLPSPSACPIKEEKSGVPDVITINLPFMYLVVTPLLLIIHSLFAERSAFYSKKPSGGRPDSGASAMVSQKSNLDRERWVRMVILLACVIFACIHLKTLIAIGRAYGIREVALSPALCWAPPIFLAAAILLSQ